MDSISASERRNSLLKTVWKRLNKSVSCWPQASAASVSSCCTAETWMAEISASVAQADPLASARLALTKQSSVADAPARKILFIATVPNFDGSPARDPDCVSSQKDPSAAKKLACNKLRDFEFPACNLAEFRHASGKGCNRRVHRAFGDGNFGPGHAGSLPGYAFAPISRRPQTGSRREQKPLSDALYRRSRPQPGCQRRPCGCFLDGAGIELHAVLQRRRGPGRRHVPAEVASWPISPQPAEFDAPIRSKTGSFKPSRFLVCVRPVPGKVGQWLIKSPWWAQPAMSGARCCPCWPSASFRSAKG